MWVSNPTRQPHNNQAGSEMDTDKIAVFIEWALYSGADVDVIQEPDGSDSGYAVVGMVIPDYPEITFQVTVNA